MNLQQIYLLVFSISSILLLIRLCSSRNAYVISSSNLQLMLSFSFLSMCADYQEDSGINQSFL